MRYKSRKIEAEAMQLKGDIENASKVSEWIRSESDLNVEYVVHEEVDQVSYFRIYGEDDTDVNEGDYVVKIGDKFYPCNAELFEEVFEL